MKVSRSKKYKQKEVRVAASKGRRGHMAKRWVKKGKK